MGLDIYFYKVKKIKYPVTLNNNDDFQDFVEKNYPIKEDIGYFRKEYMTFDYFDKVFNGVENCKEYTITKDMIGDFMEKINKCQSIIYLYGETNKEAIEKCKEILPISDKFENSWYSDEIYVDYLNEVKNQMAKCLTILDRFDCEIHYMCWW